MWCEDNPAVPLPDDPILVSPPLIEMNTGEWKRIGRFILTNRTNDPYWQIWIKFTVENEEIALGDIDIDFCNDGQDVVNRVAPVGISMYLFGFEGRDREGQRVIFLLIDRLRPSGALIS